MSVLTCPVCQGAMREVNREGILIDVCTQCRGVWLDRGELEKLAGFMGGGRDTMAMDAPPPRQMRPQQPMPQQDDYAYRERDRRRDWDDDDDDDRRRHGDDPRYHGQRKKSGVGRFLDFFD